MSSYVHTSAIRHVSGSVSGFRSGLSVSFRSNTMRTRFTRAAFITMIMSAVGAVSAAAQTIGEPDRARPTQVATLAAAPGDQVRQLTIDDAVRLALDNNLGIQIARFNPQVEDLSVALARSAWAPYFSTVVQSSSATTPNSSFLSSSTTGQNSTTNGRVASNVGVTQQTPWGGSYSVGWDSTGS